MGFDMKAPAFTVPSWINDNIAADHIRNANGLPNDSESDFLQHQGNATFLTKSLPFIKKSRPGRPGSGSDIAHWRYAASSGTDAVC